MVSHPTENEIFDLLGDSEADAIYLENVAGAVETEDPRTVGPKKPGRKRKEPAANAEQESPQTTPVKRSSRLAGQAQKENVPPTTEDFISQAQEQQASASSTQQQEDAVFNSVVQNTSSSSQAPANTSGEMENMGYDQNSTTQMANLGWDQGAPTPGGPASMGAPTPYR